MAVEIPPEVLYTATGGTVFVAYTTLVGWFVRLLASERKENRRKDAEIERAEAKVDAERQTRRELMEAHNKELTALYAELAELRKRVTTLEIELARARNDHP